MTTDEVARTRRRARLSQLQRTRAGAGVRDSLLTLLIDTFGNPSPEAWRFASPTGDGDELRIAVHQAYEKAREHASFSSLTTADRSRFEAQVVEALRNLSSPWVYVWLARLVDHGVLIIRGELLPQIAPRLLQFDGDDVVMIGSDNRWGAHLEYLDDGWSNYSYVTETWRADH